MMPAPDRKGGERQAIQTQRLDQKIYNCPCPNRSSATQLGAIWPASSVMIITGTHPRHVGSTGNSSASCAARQERPILAVVVPRSAGDFDLSPTSAADE
jgi:hypothetical protein